MKLLEITNNAKGKHLNFPSGFDFDRFLHIECRCFFHN